MVKTDYKAEHELLMVRCIDTHPFFAAMLSNFKIETRENTEFPAGVWAKNQIVHMYINPALFYKKYSPEQQIGIFQHEIWHIILRHQERKYERNHMRFNVAADLAINKNIVPENILPSDACFYPNFNLPRNLTAEEYYTLLLQQQKESMSASAGKGNGYPIPLDDHDIWEAEGDDVGLDPDLVKELVKKAVDKCGGIGNLPGNISQIISEIIQPSKVDWKRVLQMFINKNAKGKREQTWSKFSKRLPGLIKGKRKAMIPRLGCLIDCSGSISDDQLNSFHNEIYHAHKQGVPIHVVVFDTTVKNKYEYNGKFQEVVGRDGTDVRPALDYIAKVPDISAVIVLTDMETPFPNTSKYPKQTLWLSTKEGKDIVPPFGKVVMMDI